MTLTCGRLSVGWLNRDQNRVGTGQGRLAAGQEEGNRRPDADRGNQDRGGDADRGMGQVTGTLQPRLGAEEAA
jgi:hypothetical protein